MNQSDHKNHGWLHSLQRTGDSLLGLAQTRFELFTVELQEEKLRSLNLVVWLAAALALGIAGLLVGVGVLALCLWNLAGYLGLIGLMMAAFAAAAGGLWHVQRRIHTDPAPFAETLAEFRKDRECLRNDS